MSAFIVEDDLIDLIVTCARNLRIAGTVDPDAIGRKLVAQNWLSVNHRYRENDEPAPYTFKAYTGPMESLAVIKACNCYDYQACETDDYEATEVADIVRRVRQSATYDVIRTLPGYERAKWGAAPNPARRGIKCGTPVLLSSLCK
jgi:hypothetical protein